MLWRCIGLSDALEVRRWDQDIDADHINRQACLDAVANAHSLAAANAGGPYPGMVGEEVFGTLFSNHRKGVVELCQRSQGSHNLPLPWFGRHIARRFDRNPLGRLILGQELR